MTACKAAQACGLASRESGYIWFLQILTQLFCVAKCHKLTVFPTITLLPLPRTQAIRVLLFAHATYSQLDQR